MRSLTELKLLWFLMGSLTRKPNYRGQKPADAKSKSQRAREERSPALRKISSGFRGTLEITLNGVDARPSGLVPPQPVTIHDSNDCRLGPSSTGLVPVATGCTASRDSVARNS